MARSSPAHLPNALTEIDTHPQEVLSHKDFGMQVRQSLPMSQLTRISVEPLGADGHETVELTFASGAITGDAKWTYDVESAGDRTLLVRALYLFAS